MSAITRRGFLRAAAGAGGGLVLGISLSGCGAGPPWPNAEPGVFQPNAFLRIGADGAVRLTIHKAEMGQGVVTGLATLLAEELEIDPRRIRFDFARPHRDYADPQFGLMVTGGSSSISGSFETLRRAGAAAREMLRAAAARRWKVAIDQCVARDGHVELRDGSRRVSYGDLATAASAEALPAKPPLKPSGEWRLIGRFDSRIDAAQKSDGSAIFASDVHLPGMLTAVLVRCPHFGGRLRRFDATRARALRGVREALEVNGAVAVVADGYWAARRGAGMLEIEWDRGPLGGLDSAQILAEQRRRAAGAEGRVARDDGEAPMPEAVSRTLEAEYHVPYLAHATMEPMSAVASVRGESAEIWAGTQAPDVLQKAAARLLEIPRDRIVVNSTLLGGGFGRRSTLDFALEAVAVSRAVGKPVKVVWTREDDMRHDFYRPAVLTRLRATLSDSGELLSWSQRIVAPSIMARMLPLIAGGLLPAWAPENLAAPVASFVARRDPMAIEGAADLPYRVPHVRIDHVHWDPGIPVSVWRSVGHSQNAFFVESFADEVAAALGEDPLRFRLRRLATGSRLQAVLSLAAERAGWGRPAPGRFQGIAVHESFGTAVAEVAEVSVEDSRIRVHRVVCAVDCGTVVNPGIVRDQVESAVVYGLTAALQGEITIRDGAVVQSNFHDYPLLRMADCPAIEVYVVPSRAAPSGIGEPGVPPLAPAVANAVFAATRQRLRSLPLTFG